jgi:hypothetical protein
VVCLLGVRSQLAVGFLAGFRGFTGLRGFRELKPADFDGLRDIFWGLSWWPGLLGRLTGEVDVVLNRMRLLKQTVVWMLLCIGFAVMLAYWGCYWEPELPRRVPISSVISFAIMNPGSGAPRDMGFKEGFVLCTGPWEAYEVFIVEGDEFKKLLLHRSPSWKGTHKRLTLKEQEWIQAHLKGLEPHLGFHYMDPNISDGLVLDLFETPDAVGNPVLGSNNAKIADLDGLFAFLSSLGDGSGATVIEIDEATGRVRDRAIGWWAHVASVRE